MYMLQPSLRRASCTQASAPRRKGSSSADDNRLGIRRPNHTASHPPTLAPRDDRLVLIQTVWLNLLLTRTAAADQVVSRTGSAQQDVSACTVPVLAGHHRHGACIAG